MTSLPYVIQIREPVQTIHFAEQVGNIGLELNNSNQLAIPQFVLDSAAQSADPVEFLSEPNNPDEASCVFQIVYPQELNLAPAYKFIKRGRPKKKKGEETKKEPSPIKLEAKPPPLAPRTRSGRLVKLPKHIEKDFKKIELTNDGQELQLSDFKRFDEKENKEKVVFSEPQAKKRTISSQYKCPKCQKAYLGKNKMVQHLKKNPEHGPLPECFEQFNFDVWNYLFDITQKCKAGQRGAKFCEELSNLLHNVQLLKSALFKTSTDNKNCVNIDKVLGNAIGLAPGKYKFDENELYKDVTVFKLITNTEFFKPNKNSDQAKQQNGEHRENKNSEEDSDNFSLEKSDGQENNESLAAKDKVVVETATKQRPIYYSSSKTNGETLVEKPVEPSVIDNFSKKLDEDNHMAIHSDLLADNLMLHSPSNTRNSVDELMLTNVDNGANLLDNSTSSDEVMNVDQFVNERFKKIIEPDIDLSGNSINLDLPGLEFYQFHTS